MKKKLNLLTAVLLTLVLTVSLAPCAAAATTVDPETDTGSITLKVGAQGVELTLYRVGVGQVVESNLVFALQEELRSELGTDLKLNGLKASDIEKTADVLEDVVKVLPEDEIWVRKSEKENDEISLNNMPVGVYLVMQTGGDSVAEFDSFMLYLPTVDASGTKWETSVVADPKLEYSTGGGGGGGETPPPEEVPDPPVPGGNIDPDPGEELPDEDVPLAVLPQTGLLQWPIPVMTMAGLVLFAVGLLSERKRKACT